MTLTDAPARSERTLSWPVARLRPHGLNPRGRVSDADAEDLVQSVREQGVIEPLVVAPDGDGTATILCGERRWVAARLAGLTDVPVVVREVTKPAEALAVMLAENLARRDLSPLQEARAFKRLLDLGLSQHEIARRCGVQSNIVGDRLLILRLDPQVQDYFARRELPVTLVRPLSKVADAAAQRRLAARAATRQMTVAQLEEVVRRGVGRKPEPSRPDDAAQPLRPPPPRWPSRREAVELLRRTPGQTVAFRDLERVFDAQCGICKQCGLADLEAACRECPGPAMVARLARE